MGQQQIAPSFFAAILQAGFTSPLTLEKPLQYSIDESGKISFQPSGSDWIFSASIRYGRSNGKGYRHQQTNNLFGYLAIHNVSAAKHRYAETTTSAAETHDTIDFMAGKDVGLGLQGSNGTSLLSGGLRFAQFRSQSGIAAYADPDYVNPATPAQFFPTKPKHFHNYSVHAQDSTRFTGVGPALSWDSSAPIVGNSRNESITVDWSLNGAVLFGRQKSMGYHQTKGKFSSGYISFPAIGKYYTTKHYTHSLPHNRSRMVIVPESGCNGGSLYSAMGDAKVKFRLSRGHVLRRDGRRLRHCEKRKRRLLRAVCQR